MNKEFLLDTFQPILNEIINGRSFETSTWLYATNIFVCMYVLWYEYLEEWEPQSERPWVV